MSILVPLFISQEPSLLEKFRKLLVEFRRADLPGREKLHHAKRPLTGRRPFKPQHFPDPSPPAVSLRGQAHDLPADLDPPWPLALRANVDPPE